MANTHSPTSNMEANVGWSWGHHLLIGILFILLSLFIFGATLFTTYISVFMLGLFFCVGGFVEFISIFTSSSNRLANALIGILGVIVGILILTNPLITAETVTLLLAIFLTIGGLAQMLGVWFSDMSHKFWISLAGFITFVLGVMIWARWPTSSLYAWGILIGIYFFVAGIRWCVEAFALRRLTPAH